MKRTELAKAKALALVRNMKLAGIPDRFGKDAAVAIDKREQRKRDQAQGLVPFAVKLDAQLIKAIHDYAGGSAQSLNDATATLLRKALP